MMTGLVETAEPTWHERIATGLLVFVPAAIVLEFLHVAPAWRFIVSSLAIIPLAGLIGKSTEHLTARVGAGLRSFLNEGLRMTGVSGDFADEEAVFEKIEEIVGRGFTDYMANSKWH